VGCVIGFLLLVAALRHDKIMAVSWFSLLWVAAISMSLVLCVVYFARRAAWLCLFRSAFLAMFMLPFAGACLLGAMDVLNFDDSLSLAIAALAFFIVCVYLFHTRRTVPYWRLTLAQNTAKKIDLKSGVFSVTTEWAPFPGDELTKSGRNFLVYGLGPVGALLGITFSKGFAGTPWGDVMFAVLAFCLLGIAAFSDTEAYFAYKLLELERQIGRPIVMDGYQKEEHPAESAGRE
jgi:predicted neutral ceramidase superfamily lipid hydrolase